VTGIKGQKGELGGFTVGSDAQVNSLGIGTAASGTSGQIRATGDITAFYSDRRLKDIEGNIPNALELVTKLNGVYYTNNDLAKYYGYDDTSRMIGVIAQEVQSTIPEAVKPAPFDIGINNTSKSGNNYLTVQYEKIVPLLIEAIKELNEKVDKLQR
jgi:hypothetical protein